MKANRLILSSAVIAMTMSSWHFQAAGQAAPRAGGGARGGDRGSSGATSSRGPVLPNAPGAGNADANRNGSTNSTGPSSSGTQTNSANTLNPSAPSGANTSSSRSSTTTAPAANTSPGTGAGPSSSSTQTNSTTTPNASSPSGATATFDNPSSANGEQSPASGANASSPKSSSTAAPAVPTTPGTGAGAGASASPTQAGAAAAAGSLLIAGTVGEFSNGLLTMTTPSGSTSVITTPETVYMNSNNRPVAIDSIKPTTPVSVHYTRSGNQFIASRIVVSAPPPDFSAGEVTEVSPGVLVVKLPDASPTPVRYVNNETTNYTDENGRPVSAELVKSGAPVKVYYTKVGDTLVASRVEVQTNSGLPKPPVSEEVKTTTTTTTKKEAVRP